jgi:hypothetical protein
MNARKHDENSLSPRLLPIALLLGALAACGNDDDPKTDASGGSGGSAGSGSIAGGGQASEDGGGAAGAAGVAGAAGAVGSAGHLIVVTERESAEAKLQYLHILKEWPEGAELDYDQAIELDEFVNVHAMGAAVFVYKAEDATIRKLVIGANGKVAGEKTISLASHGVAGFSGDMVYATSDRAYLVDEAAGLIVTWNPEAMKIVGSAPIDAASLDRNGLAAQISRGVAVGDQGFVSASWRNWETFEYHDAAAMGVFDATAIKPALEIIEDDRCASTVTVPFDGGDGFVYLISDAALGFDALANPTLTEKALCVLRMQPGSGKFDADFLVDLKEVLGSPGFYAAHPMRDGKLLVNLWAPDVDVADVADPQDPNWYWNYPPYFEYAIVDLATATSVPVKDLPRAAVQWSITARVDGDTFVQAYRDDAGSDVYRVNPDASVEKVLVNGMGTDVQYLGRVAE